MPEAGLAGYDQVRFPPFWPPGGAGREVQTNRPAWLMIYTRNGWRPLIRQSF